MPPHSKRISTAQRMIVRPSVLLAAMGLGTGALVGGWTSRALAPMLYGRTAFDASILLVVAAALASMVLLGTILPARRAIRVDPATVLRQE
jgi:ABC-type antimicrobial peptide transport system permease subunit